MRWVRRFVPELEKRWNRFVRKAVRSWRVDETYVKIRGEWTYRALCALAQFDFFTRPALGLLAEAEAQTGSGRSVAACDPLDLEAFIEKRLEPVEMLDPRLGLVNRAKMHVQFHRKVRAEAQARLAPPEPRSSGTE